MTCRQVFYRAVTSGVIGKTEGEYKQTIIRLLTEMRKSKELPWQWLADNTRWQRKPDTSTGLVAMLNRVGAGKGAVVEVIDGGTHKDMPIRTVMFRANP